MTGSELAAIRKAAALSQTELAKRAGISRHAVSYWECKGAVNLWATAMMSIAGVLGLPRPWAIWLQARQTLNAEDVTGAVTGDRAASNDTPIRYKLPVIEYRFLSFATRCGAKTRKGTPCRCKPLPGKKRCKFHGGLSTGARTAEGRERIVEAQRRRWAKWRAERGLPQNRNKS